MSPSKSKGKGKRSHRDRTPTPSSDDRRDDSFLDESLAQPPLTQARQRKKQRARSSPERVMKSTLDIMENNTRSRGSGLAKFSALMSSHQKVDAATQESIRGMKGKAKSMPKMSAKASPTYDDPDSIRVGRIVFIITGITKAKIGDYFTGGFSPVYETKGTADVSPRGLVRLIQFGLCKVAKDGYLFNVNDSFVHIDNILRAEFPLLFTYLDAHPPPEEFAAALSPWLVCIKQAGRKPGVLVFSSDQDGQLPNGADIVDALSINKRSKRNFQETTLYLVTRARVHPKAAKEWSIPSNTALEKYQQNLGNSSDISASPHCDSGSDLGRQDSLSLSPIAGPSRILRSHSGAIITYDPGDVISLSSGESSPNRDKPETPPRLPSPIIRTSPLAEPNIERLFTSSMLLDDLDADPWGPGHI